MRRTHIARRVHQRRINIIIIIMVVGGIQCHHLKKYHNYQKCHLHKLWMMGVGNNGVVYGGHVNWQKLPVRYSIRHMFE